METGFYGSIQTGDPDFGNIEQLEKIGNQLILHVPTSGASHPNLAFTSDTEILVGTLFTFKEGATLVDAGTSGYGHEIIYSSKFYKTTTAGVWDDDYSILSINAIPYYI